MIEKNSKWESVESVDYSRRKQNEWEKIYGIKLLSEIDDRIWSEYEWSYHMCKEDYKSIHKDFEKIAIMEMRAMELRRDIFMGANLSEREILSKNYIETEWVRKKLNVLY